MLSAIWIELSVATFLILVIFGATELGYRRGRSLRTHGESTDSPQLATVQTAILGLLGLLLGFSFAGAGSRFIDRHDLIVKEANAIGTAYLRADLLNEPHRTGLRQTLREYTDNRVNAFGATAAEPSADRIKTAEALHGRMWRFAVAGVKQSPEHDESVLPPVNEVIDLHTTRIATGTRHIPTLVLGLLIFCSALAVASVGYGCGLAGKRQVLLTVAIKVLVVTMLWITIDLDHPRRGLIRLNQAPLETLQQSLQLDADAQD